MYADILILGHLVAGPRHGYDIKKRVARILGEALNNNVLYPTLRRLEQVRAVARQVERREGHPDRHVYRLTERGLEVLQDRLREFPPAVAADDGEFHTRLAFFHLLDPLARRAILDARRAVLAQHAAQLTDFLAEVGDAEAMRWSRRVIAFQQQRTQQEIAWIDQLAREVEA